tara:strand:- start:379 stop:657 length:279 start_codon:yes stop_codon:yes gene_type:complete
MKINIWIQRDDLWETNRWLTESNLPDKRITFFHDKPVKQMDVVQVSISIDEYQQLIDSNEAYDERVAAELGWVQSTTIDPDTDIQLQVLFGD